jgi:outer membrane cobalamin receptor
MARINCFLFRILLLTCWRPLFVFPQELPVKHIPEVTVIKGNQEFFSDDQTAYRVDMAFKPMNNHQPIGYVLEQQSPLMVRTYGGQGSLASVSLHGTGSNHTQVTWNGFPLNSPTTGQADLSLIPAGFMQSAEIIHGASGALFGSGTFGGAIALSNKPDWNNELAVDYSFGAGSFGATGHMLGLRTGKARLQYNLSVITREADNDFAYTDHYRYNSPERKMQHNAYRSFGLMQNLHLNLNKGNHLEAGFWYQFKTLEIPAIMGSYKTSHATQKDSLFRTFVNYRKISRKSALVLKTALFSDFLAYRDKNEATDTVFTIDSRIATRRWMNELDYRYYISRAVILGGGASYYQITGHSGNYGGRLTEHEFALFGNLKISLAKVIVNAGLRKEFYKGLNPRLQYSFGIRYQPAEYLVVRSGFSSKFRKPTFNEKYWRPGGNSALIPEQGRGGEITLEWTTGDREEKPFWLEARLTGYYQWIDNWIQWVIRDSLTPVEYKRVHARGLETWLESGFNRANFTLKGLLYYAYNRSEIIRTYDQNMLYAGNQLMYVPLHNARGGLDLSYKGFSIGFNAMGATYRETVETADKTLRLPGYALFNVLAGYQLKILNFDLSSFFQVDNLFNRHYEVIRAYPMPGRSFHFTLTIGYHKSSANL